MEELESKSSSEVFTVVVVATELGVIEAGCGEISWRSIDGG